MEDKNISASEFDRLSRAIKTAVTSINGFIVMAEERSDRFSVNDCLMKIGYSAKNLLEELSIMQTVRELKDGNVEFKNHPIFIPQLIQSTTANLAAMVGAKNVGTEIIVSGLRDLSLICDDELMVKVFSLLVKNLLEYIPAGGKLTITFDQLPDEKGKCVLEITFSDNGLGIPPKKLERIFEYDPNDIGNEYTGGAALWIANCYVNMGGGTMTVTSVENLSTTVKVKLLLDRSEPLRPSIGSDLKGLKLLLVSPDAAESRDIENILTRLGVNVTATRSHAEAITLIDKLAAKRSGYDVVLVNGDAGGVSGGVTAATDIRRHSGAITQIILYSYSPEELVDRARAIGVKAVLPRPIFGYSLAAAVKTRGSWYEAGKDNASVNLNDKHILIVEDNELNMEMAKSLIEEMTGAVVECAYNGREAVNCVRRNGHNYYSMVFMDINMPVMNGLDATRAIRAADDFYTRNLPIVAMTAGGSDLDKKAAVSSGMNDVITKPFEPTRIIETMKKFKI